MEPGQVLPARIAWWADRTPDRPFMQEVTGRRASYAGFLDEVCRWSSRLSELGVRRGDRVISLLPTSIDASALWLGAGVLGAVEVPVNPDLRGSFLTHALRDPGATWCFVRPEHADLPGSVEVPGLEIVVVPRDGSFTADADSRRPDVWPAPTDPSCVIYTSGTTGASKGVVISWAQMSATIGRIPRSWLGPDDVTYSYHPMFHVTGRSPLPAMADVGGRIVLREKLSLTEFWDDVRRYGCTSTTVNTALALAQPERADDADNPLRFALVGGARPLALRFAERFGVHVFECYGSTEIGFPIVLRDMVAGPGRACGYLRRGYSARVVDDAGEEVPDGTPGELLVRPPLRPLMTSGYLGRDDLTEAAIVDGWYRTGDRMVRNSDGSYVFVDRMKDTIRRLGENISATALEAAVLELGVVAECAVVGVPDPIAGHEVLIAALPRPGHDLTPVELHTVLAAALPKHMVPRYVCLPEELPRTATNKVRKTTLIDGFDRAVVWDARAPR